jgi:predicted nucleotidyltransferase
VNEASRVLLIEVARALGDLLDRVVFIGGTVAPLLQSDPVFAAPRPTADVDAIALTVSYTDFEAFREQLRTRGFQEKLNSKHAHRWTTPGPLQVPLDVVPIGTHLGASGNRWDQAALDTAVALEIADGLHIRHVSAPAFVALKLAAFTDRGQNDPFTSDDLEDIFALIASRREITDEVKSAPPNIREFVRDGIRDILAKAAFEDLMAAHLGNVARTSAAQVIPRTEERFRTLAEG